MKRVLIVGGNSNVARALKARIEGSAMVITAGIRGCDITLDLREDSKSIEDKIYMIPDIDALIVTAADFSTAPLEVSKSIEVNVVGTLKLYRAALLYGNVKHFVYISSISSLLDPASRHYDTYSFAKKQAEDALRFAASMNGNNDVKLTILRPSRIYGDDDGFRRHQPFFYYLMDTAQAGKEISIYGSHDPLRNYLHIDDLTKIIEKVIDYGVCGTYDCQHPNNISNSQIAKLAQVAFDKKVDVVFLKDKPKTDDNIFDMDFSLYDKIGFYPQVSVVEGIKRIAKYRRAKR